MSTNTLNDLDDVLAVLENIRLEKRGVLKMKVLSDAVTKQNKQLVMDLELLLSVYSHGLLECPKPKWKNSSQYEKGQCVAVLTRILSGAKVDTKEFHELPLKVQTVLYYSSIRSDIGLNQSQLLSTISVMSKEAIYYTLGFSDAVVDEVDTWDMLQKCPRCGSEQETPVLCKDCQEKLLEAVEHRTESFEVYGTSAKDFNSRFLDWSLEVQDGLYKFAKLKESIERYEPTLPFVEYQKTLQLIG